MKVKIAIKEKEGQVMYTILEKERLNPFVSRVTIEDEKIAKKAKPGQFVILQVDENGERIPLTVADFDRNKGTISIIFQIVGTTTKKLDNLKVGEKLYSLVGPLGKETEVLNYKKAAVIGGGVGCAIAYPLAKALKENGCQVHSILGFRNKELIILENEFKSVSQKTLIMTDDGSNGNKGLVTDALKSLLTSGEKYDVVFVIGPLIMMKFVSLLTKEYNLKTIVSMNPIMIDGTGMCGGCRLTVDGKIKFACIDGPDFDGHKVDFDELINRNNTYREFEKKSFEKTCNLFKCNK